VAWIVAAMAGLGTAGWGITIPVTAYGTGFSSSGTLLTADNTSDGNWTFYSGTGLSALSGTPEGAWVFTANRQPLNNGTWAANSTSSVWISPTSNRANGGHLATVPGTSYIAVTTFTIPAMQDPPNWPQWWLVMSGTVWADQGVSGNNFYLLKDDNSVAFTGSLSGTAGPLSPAGFQLSAWVQPGATYKLAFILPNTPDTWAGFRLQLTEAYVTPEPGGWVTMATAGVGLALVAWRRRRSKKPVA
jgi:hypothetical protein